MDFRIGLSKQESKKVLRTWLRKITESKTIKLQRSTSLCVIVSPSSRLLCCLGLFVSLSSTSNKVLPQIENWPQKKGKKRRKKKNEERKVDRTVEVEWGRWDLTVRKAVCPLWDGPLNGDRRQHNSKGKKAESPSTRSSDSVSFVSICLNKLSDFEGVTLVTHFCFSIWIW